VDVDLYVMLYEQRADGEYVRLFDPSYEFRASYAAIAPNAISSRRANARS